MPEGESMFNYHGYSGPCPKPPLPKSVVPTADDVLYIRCMKHRGSPQYNANAAGGAECAACEIEPRGVPKPSETVDEFFTRWLAALKEIQQIANDMGPGSASSDCNSIIELASTAVARYEKEKAEGLK